MTEDEFDVLAAKVLAGEATVEETARLEEAFAQDPELQEEFAELRATWTTLKEAGPLANALNTPPTLPPKDRLTKWHSAVEQQFGPSSEREEVFRRRAHDSMVDEFFAWFRRKFRVSPWAVAAVSLILALVAGFFLWQRPSSAAPSEPAGYLVANRGAVEMQRNGKTIATTSGTTLRGTDEIRLGSQASATVITPAGTLALRGPGTFAAASFSARSATATNNPPDGTLPMLRTALFQSPTQMLALLVTTRSSPGLPIYSPVGFTASLTPSILWKSDPGKSYDVEITDEFSPASAALRKTNATSPLEFTNAWPGRVLVNDGLYRLRIAEAGNPITARELTFRTLPRADETELIHSADKLMAAYEMLVTSPPRFGDALAILLTLPPERAGSELAARLKVFAFGRLGYHDDFHAAVEQLKARRSGVR